MFASGDGIEDRLAARFDDAGDDEAGPPPIDVDVEIDLAEDRLVHLVERRGENVENRRAGLGVLAAQNAEQRLPLRRSRPLVDNDGGFAFALVNGAGPSENPGNLEAVEPRAAVMAGVDLDADDGPAGSVRG